MATQGKDDLDAWKEPTLYSIHQSSLRERRIITFACYSSSKLAFISEDGIMNAMDVLDLDYIQRVDHDVGIKASHMIRPGRFAISANEYWLADWHRPGSMLVWNLSTDLPSLHSRYVFPMTHVSSLEAEGEEYVAATFDCHSASLVAVSDRPMVWSWNVASGIPLRRPARLRDAPGLTLHSRAVFSRHGMRLGWIPEPMDPDDVARAKHAGLGAHVVMVLDLSTPTRPSRPIALWGHSDRIHAFAFSSDGHFVATASADKTVRLWRTTDGRCLETFTEHNTEVTHVVISENGRVLASGGKDGTVRVRKMERVLLRDAKNGYYAGWEV